MEHKQKMVLMISLGLLILLGIILVIARGLDRKITGNQITGTDSKDSPINYFPSENVLEAIGQPGFESVAFESFEKWASYRSNEMGIEITYPHELFLDVDSTSGIIFDYLSPNDPKQTKEDSVLVEFKISLQNENIDTLVKERALDKLINFKQESVSLNNIATQQISYTDAFSGGTFYEVYIPQGSNTVVVWYAGNNQLETIFNKMLSTIRYSKGAHSIVDDKALLQYSFCGQAYKAIPVLINTIDVVRRITEIAAVNKSEYICENINTNATGQDILSVEIKQFPGDVDYKASDYYVTIGILTFKVDTVSNKIYVLEVFDGTPAYIGALIKK